MSRSVRFIAPKHYCACESSFSNDKISRSVGSCISSLNHTTAGCLAAQPKEALPKTSLDELPIPSTASRDPLCTYSPFRPIQTGKHMQATLQPRIPRLERLGGSHTATMPSPDVPMRHPSRPLRLRPAESVCQVGPVYGQPTREKPSISTILFLFVTFLTHRRHPTHRSGLFGTLAGRPSGSCGMQRQRRGWLDWGRWSEAARTWRSACCGELDPCQCVELSMPVPGLGSINRIDRSPCWERLDGRVAVGGGLVNLEPYHGRV